MTQSRFALAFALVSALLFGQAPDPNHRITIASPFASGGFGSRILGLSDWNGDGFSDYLVTAPSAPFVGGQGQVRVISGRTSSTIIDMFGDQTSSQFGNGICEVGDTNNDGVPDLCVGAAHHDALVSNGGRVWLYSGIDGSVLWTTDGSTAFGEFGSTVVAVGDLNGDSLADIAVSQVGFPPFGRIVFLDAATGAVLGATEGPAGASGLGAVLVGNSGNLYASDNGGRIYIVGTPFAGVGVATLLLSSVSGAAAPAQLALLANPVSGYDLLVGRPFTDAPVTNAGSVALHVGGNPVPLLTVTGSTLAEGVGVRIAAIRDYDRDGQDDILYLSGAVGAPLSTGRVRIISRTGALLLDQNVTGATGSTSWFSSIEDVTGDGRGEWLVGIVNGNAGMSEGQLWASGLMLPTKSLTPAGFTASYQIDFGPSQGNRIWIQAYGISGNAPGTNFGSGQPLVPLNFDLITNYVFSLAGTPTFPDVFGVLSPAGVDSSSLFLPTPAVVLLTGLSLRTAVAAFDPGTALITGVSNPLTVVLQ